MRLALCLPLLLFHARAPLGVTRDTLTAPPVLRTTSARPHTVEVALIAAPTRLSLQPGTSSELYAYNGSVPGPTIEAWEGDRVIIHFRNELPVPTTIHWHGLHIPADMDGSPLRPVAPGHSYTYSFTLARGTAGTYWYHPHPDAQTGGQLARGLFGAFIVRAHDDPLARSFPERLIILWDNRFRPDGAVDIADPESPQGEVDEENGREGNVIFVNGRVMPTVRIRSGEIQRWRIVNASAARAYRLAIPGTTLLQVGSDGGLFEHAVAVPDILVVNSERVELLVRGTGAPGSSAMLESLPYDRYMPQTRPADYDRPRDLVRLEYSVAPAVVSPTIPATLRRIPVLDTLGAVKTQLVVMSQGLINGRTMDMARSDLHARLGTTEIWQLENVVGMDHPFHLHGFQFQVLDRDGVPVPYRSWKDVVNVPKHSTVRFVVHYADFPGRWMFHCHILDHEDEGMMGILEVQ